MLHRAKGASDFLQLDFLQSDFLQSDFLLSDFLQLDLLQHLIFTTVFYIDQFL